MNDFKSDLVKEFAYLRNQQNFKVLKQLEQAEVGKWGKTYIPTRHLQDRLSRIQSYTELELVNDNFLYGFEVDKGHKNGPEVHILNETALIYIFNRDSRRFITVLGARPGQIKRYFRHLNKSVPADLDDVLARAEQNVNNGVNYL